MPNWVTADPTTGRLIIKSILTLIELGVPERLACRRIAVHYGGDILTLIQVWAKVKLRMQKRRTFKLPPLVRFPAKCVYCGCPGRMIPVMDHRPQAVGAHEQCELMEQMIAGGL